MRRRAKAPTERDSAWIVDALHGHERSLTLYATRLLGDAHRARDVVQEAFLRLCRCERSEVEARVAEWLFRVTRNLALDQLRKEGRMGALGDEEARTREADAPPPGEAIERDDTLARVVATMRALPPKQQEVLRLKFQHGLSYKEISRITDESVGNVGWLVHVGIQRLREELAGDELKGAQA